MLLMLETYADADAVMTLTVDWFRCCLLEMWGYCRAKLDFEPVKVVAAPVTEAVRAWGRICVVHVSADVVADHG